MKHFIPGGTANLTHVIVAIVCGLVLQCHARDTYDQRPGYIFQAFMLQVDEILDLHAASTQGTTLTYTTMTVTPGPTRWNLAGDSYEVYQGILMPLCGLGPLSSNTLERLVNEVDTPEQRKEVFSQLERLDSLQLLTMLKDLGVQEQMEVLSQLKVLESLGLLRMLEGLQGEELRTFLKQIKGMSPLGQLNQLKELELLGQLKLMRLMKSFKQEQELFKTTKLQEKMATFGSGILKVELARLGKSGQESEREERLRLFLEHYKNLQQQLVEWLVIYLSEDGGRGSFRNLLLDGWWLGLWELILLVAGDVERNPGPRRMTDQQLASVDSRALGKGDLRDVYDAVYDCRVSWYNLCLALRVSDNDLSAIKKEQASDIDACLCKGLSLWLQGDYDVKKYGSPTWRMLVDAAANSSAGKYYALALEISNKYKAIPTAPLQISTLNCVHVDLEVNEKSEKMSSDFSRMYRSVIRHLRVNVCEVRDSLRFLTDPRHPDQLCVPPSVYEDATTTKKLLTCLCPRYVNPKKTFVLKEVVREFGSQKCKKLLRDYTEKFQ